MSLRRFSPPQPEASRGIACRGEERHAAANPDAFFTIPHFDGYSAVLIQLPDVADQPLREAITDGWLVCAPPKLADAHLRDR